MHLWTLNIAEECCVRRFGRRRTEAVLGSGLDRDGASRWEDTADGDYYNLSEVLRQLGLPADTTF